MLRFIDDVIVYSKSEWEKATRLENVFQRSQSTIVPREVCICPTPGTIPILRLI